MADRIIRCRAHVSPDCLHGRPSHTYYEPPNYEMEDGTYEPQSMTVVCDPCFVDLMPLTPTGQGLMHELTSAIERHRKETDDRDA